MEKLHIFALIPAHNEATHIGEVVRVACQHLPVLVVDDGSSDATAEIASGAGAIVIRQFPNQGKGAALQTGFRYALSKWCKAVISLDGDGQHDPNEIPLFLRDYAQTQADLIIGVRQFDKMPFLRRLGNSSGRMLFSWAIGRPIPDNQSGYRLISRRLMETMLNTTVGGFEFEVETIVQCVLQGFRLQWVPIRTIYSGQKSHIRPVSHVLRFLGMVWQVHQRMSHPKRTESIQG